MKKILIIDEYELIRNYLSKKLASYPMQIFAARNGLEGMILLRKSDPDLIIMDTYLTRKTFKEILTEKLENPNIAAIPIIILATHKGNLPDTILRKYNIRFVLAKPLKVDLLFKAITSVLGIPLPIDPTPCILEVHFNTDILFIEIANGLNQEKIELLAYKIMELLELYKASKPKILLIMSDITEHTTTPEKFTLLITTILNHTSVEMVKLLTSSEIVRTSLESNTAFAKIEITDRLEKAMNSLTGIKITDFLEEGKNIIKKDFLSNTETLHREEENIALKFDRETKQLTQTTIAVVDDDPIIHQLIQAALLNSNGNVQCFLNGKEFIAAGNTLNFDIIFLDLVMPIMDGFHVLSYLKEHNIHCPVIILSAYTSLETVERVRKFGVKSYLMKPLHGDTVRRKTWEILKKNF